MCMFFFFKQKTAYEMRISDWSSDVCSSDLKESEGLILLTSNGDIVNEILRAENAKEKEYLVGVNREVSDEFLRGMARGDIVMHGQRTRPCRATRLGKLGFRIVLTQGLNRQIRLMAAHFGYRVKR